MIIKEIILLISLKMLWVLIKIIRHGNIKYHKIHTLSVILETSVECMCFLHVLAVSRDNPSSGFLTGSDKNRACTSKENGKRI